MIRSAGSAGAYSGRILATFSLNHAADPDQPTPSLIADPRQVKATGSLRKAFQTPSPVGETIGLRDLANYERVPADHR